MDFTNSISIGETLGILTTVAGAVITLIAILIKNHINFVNKVLNLIFILERLIDRKVFQSDLNYRHADFVGNNLAHGSQTVEMVRGCLLDYFIGPVIRETPKIHLQEKSILEHVFELSCERSLLSYILDSNKAKLRCLIIVLLGTTYEEIDKFSKIYDFIKQDNFTKDLNMFQKYLNQTKFLGKIDLEDIKKKK